METKFKDKLFIQQFKLPSFLTEMLPSSQFNSLAEEILKNPVKKNVELELKTSKPLNLSLNEEKSQNETSTDISPSVPESQKMYINEGLQISTSNKKPFKEKADITSYFLEDLKSANEDWNTRFQEILDNILGFAASSSFDSKIQANVQLIQLFQDFVLSAKTYGKIILSEVCLPDEKKLIKPVSLGGQAGGSKYIVNNILFKLAVGSTDLLNGDDYIAAKISGHDLKGLTSWYNCSLHHIRLPLMIILDYRGYRLLCQSILPISSETLIYGSADAGQHVLADEGIISKMNKAIKFMHLQPHHVNGVLLGTAADVEGHKGKDGRYYLCDLSRTLPPESPSPNKYLSHLYCLFRSEFLHFYNKPLCADSFSGFLDEKEKEIYNEQIHQATQVLLKEVVPSAAKDVDEASSSHPFLEISVTEILHNKGVNMRHLDKVRKHCQTASGKTLILIEILARVIKNILRTNLRSMTKKLQILLEEPYVRLIIEFLNLVFGNTPESTKYWNGDLKDLLLTQFPESLFPEETVPNFELKTSLNAFSLTLLLKRLQAMMGINFSKSLQLLLSKEDNSVLFSQSSPFHFTDLIEIGERMKFLNIIAHAQGYLYKMKARDLFGKEHELHYYLMAEEKFRESLMANPTNAVTLRNCAQVVTSIAILKGIDPIKLKEGHDLYIKAIQYNPDTHSFFQYATFLEAWTEQYEDIERSFLLSLKIDPNHWDALYMYHRFLKELGRKELAEKFLKRANEVKTPKEYCKICKRPGHLEMHCDKLYKSFFRGRLVNF